jgi:hypothetical protein
MMVRNLEQRRCPLRSIHAYPRCPALAPYTLNP